MLSSHFAASHGKVSTRLPVKSKDAAQRKATVSRVTRLDPFLAY